jgi:hypothetical protein
VPTIHPNRDPDGEHAEFIIGRAFARDRLARNDGEAVEN